MKRFYLALICLLCLSVAAYAGGGIPLSIVAGQPVASGVSCTIKQQSEEGTLGEERNLGQWNSDKWYATKFVYSGTDNKGICKICSFAVT